MSVENLNKDEKKEASKETKEGDKVAKREYKPSEKISEIRKQEQEDKKSEGNPDDILNNFPNATEKGDNPLGNLEFYVSKETTPTGKSNEWAKNMQGLSKNDIAKICADNNLNTSSNKAFQGDIYNKLLASKEGQELILKMWREFAVTKLGSGGERKDGVKLSPEEITKINKILTDVALGKNVSRDDLAYCLKAFQDGDLGARTIYLLTLIGKTKIPPPEKEVPREVKKQTTDLIKSMFNQMKFDENKFVQSYNGISNLSIGDVTYLRGKNTDKMGFPDGVIMLDTRGKTENERNDGVMMKVIKEYGLDPGAKYMLLYKTQNETTTTNNFTETIRKAIETKSIIKVPETTTPEELQNMLATATAKL